MSDKLFICDEVMRPCLMAFTILGAPRTKGNSRETWRNKLTGQRYHVPSRQYRMWLLSADLQARDIQRQMHFVSPITKPVSVRAIFYVDRLGQDIDNLFKGCGDALQKCGFIKNDRQIRSWDGSRIAKDAVNPRMEIEISEFKS